MKTKYRIYQINGWYYPERKTWLGWRRFHDVPHFGLSISSSGPWGFSAFTHEDAQQWLKSWVVHNTPVVHEIDPTDQDRTETDPGESTESSPDRA